MALKKYTWVFLALFTTSAHAGHCGPGLAAEDLSGNCRTRPNSTAGALEADAVDDGEPAPIPAPSIVSIGAIWTADIFNDGTKGFDKPWDHCTGRQGKKVCRVVAVFDLSALPDKPIKSVKLRINITYVRPGVEADYWTVGRYIGDPKTDFGIDTFDRATCPAYILKSTLLRTVGVKNLAINKSIADVQAAIKSGRTLAVFVKAVNETPDRFVAIGRYNDPALRPTLVVGYQ